MKKKHLCILVFLIFSLIALTGCGGKTENTGSQDDSNVPAEVPSLKVSYIFTNHQTPIMVAAAKGEEFKDGGVYLKEKIDRQKYELISDGKTAANIELITCKSGSETMTMMAQGHVDIGVASSAANIAGMDKGMKLHMLCPIHTEGIGLVVGIDSEVDNWEDFKKFVAEKDKPVKVGYHSPTSAPIILFEAAIKKAGISHTYNPEDLDADILLVDLKGTSNLLPAMISNQVDAWVGPSPYPELSVTENAGKIALDMKHMPPEGEWYEFPCCVVSATDKTISEHPEVVESFIKLISCASDYSNENKAEAASITAQWTGVSEEAAKMSSIKYTTDPSEAWVSNLGLVYNTLKNSNRLDGNFVDKEYEEVQDVLFDFSFVK